MDELLQLVQQPQQAGLAARTLFTTLKDWRQRQSADAWRRWVAGDPHVSPLRRFAHQCPISARNFYKPRGYAGDAATLDLIYGLAGTPAERGNPVALVTSAAPAARAVRFRRAVLAQAIDEACLLAGPRSARLLSVACGHLREIELSTHARAGDFDTFVAMDQDVESLRTLQADYGTLGIQACPASVRDLLKGRVAPILQSPPFDLIYAAGLYDYLDEEAARALTAMLFSRLKPGGRLLVANFMPDLPDSAYMEAMMDWWLIYRSDDDMRRLAPPGAAGIRLFHDPDHAIVFMDLLAAHGD